MAIKMPLKLIGVSERRGEQMAGKCEILGKRHDAQMFLL
jgi:hypothetical protein